MVDDGTKYSSSIAPLTLVQYIGMIFFSIDGRFIEEISSVDIDDEHRSASPSSSFKLKIEKNESVSIHLFVFV